MNRNIKVAVLTGNHYFEEKPLKYLFDNIDGVSSEIMDLSEFSDKSSDLRDEFDVVIFYHMYTKTPCEYNQSENQRIAIEDIGNSGKGIIVLHHSLLAFRGWTEWYDMVGYKLRNFNYTSFQEAQYKVINKEHPITYGMSSYTINDELYETDEPTPVGSEILITTDNPYSTHAVGWTRKWKNSPVFCFQNGHCYTCYENEFYKRIIRNAIYWLSDISKHE